TFRPCELFFIRFLQPRVFFDHRRWIKHIVVIRVDNRLLTDRRRLFQYPIGRFLFLKTTSIADKLFYLVIFVFTCGDAQYFLSLIPQSNLTGASGAIAMRIYRFREPYPILKTKRFIRQRSYRTYINDISDKIIVQCVLNISRYFRMVAPIYDTMLALLR